MPLKVLDLFSGMGGFSLGLESTGYFETVAFCEKDEFCKKVLQKHWSQLKIYDDVRSLYDTKIQADVVTGGFPCQAFSQAGLQKGRTDDRWLWNEMFDVIKQVRPRWVIGENVQGIVNIEKGMVLRQVQNDLEGEGFKVQCFIIPASGIGAWHNRNRVWILANSEHNGLHRQKTNETFKSSDKQKDRLFIRDDKNVPNTKSRRYRGGNSQGCENKEWTFLPREQEGGKMGSKIERRSNVSNTDKQRTQVQAEGKQSSIKLSGSKSKETWWETESRVCGVPDGVSYGVDRDRAKRIKALGNSIVPQIARQIGLAIMEAENDN
tara:strand:- start:120 stop:1082 length:963 start_codon:yes stop_codon:yes gene_type:complete